MNFYKLLSKRIPGLADKLRTAGIMDEPEEYAKKMAFMSGMMSIGVATIIFMFFPNILVFLLVFLLAPIMFMYFIKFVDIKIEALKRRVDQEVVFAGRFLIIELQSGVALDKCFEHIQKNYAVVGAYFGDIVNKIYLGTSIEDAINETLLTSPSPTLRRILWQVLNSLKTGSDVGPALNSVIEHIVKEQQIAVQEYGKKLNPLAMFYMMISVIVPSIGMVMVVVAATFMGLSLSLTVLLSIAGFVGFIQMMFLSMIKSSRPPISM